MLKGSIPGCAAADICFHGLGSGTNYTGEVWGDVKPQVLSGCCGASFSWLILRGDCCEGTQWLGPFPIAVRTNDHCLRTARIYSLRIWKVGSKSSQGAVLCEGSRREMVPGGPLSGGLPQLEAACALTSVLVRPSEQTKARGPSVPLSPLHESHLDNPHNLPILRFNNTYHFPFDI